MRAPPCSMTCTKFQPLQSTKAVANEEDVLPWTLTGSTRGEQTLDVTPVNGN